MADDEAKLMAKINAKADQQFELRRQVTFLLKSTRFPSDMIFVAIFERVSEEVWQELLAGHRPARVGRQEGCRASQVAASCPRPRPRC